MPSQETPEQADTAETERTLIAQDFPGLRIAGKFKLGPPSTLGVYTIEGGVETPVFVRPANEGQLVREVLDAFGLILRALNRSAEREAMTMMNARPASPRAKAH